MTRVTVFVGLICLVAVEAATSSSGLEVPPPQTECSRTFALTEGRFAAEIVAGPIHHLSASDGWQPAGTDGIDSMFPDQANWWTGRVINGTKPSSALIYFGNGGSGTAEGWAKFNLSPIPDGATVASVTLRYYCYQLYMMSSAAPDIRVFQPIGTDPVTATAAEILSAITSGLVVSDSTPHSTGWISRPLKSDGVTAVQSRLTDNWIAIGFHETRSNPGFGGQAWGWNQVSPDYRPRLLVTYTTPVDIRAVSAGTYTYPLVEGETDSVTARFSNLGTANAAGTKIYALRGGAKFDSLTLASFPAGTDTTVYFRFTTPPCDGSRHYYAFVGYHVLDGFHSNDTAKYDDWTFPPGTYRAEGFDYASLFPPPGWVSINGDGGSYVWSPVIGFAHSGTKSTWCAGELPLTNDDWLVSAPVVPATGYVDSVGFFYATRLASSSDSFEVYAMRGQTMGDIIARLFAVRTNSTTYQEAKVSLEPYAGQTVFIGFRKLGLSSNQLLLDDVWWMRRSGDDVGVGDIRAPADSVIQGTQVAPEVLVKNYGIHDATFSVRFEIKLHGVPVYDTTETGVFLRMGDSAVHTFSKAWTAAPRDTFALTAHTILGSDCNPRNDTGRGTCVVEPAMSGGWDEREPMPVMPSGRDVKDGGWLTYMFWNGSVYAGKGNKVPDFYSYSPAGNTWRQLTPIPNGSEGKPPSKGAFGVADGTGRVYMVKGNNTLAFWRYDVIGDSWRQLADVLPGLAGKKVKGGDGLAYVDNPDPAADHVYLLKGQSCEFYRYEVGTDAWLPLQDAPVGLKPKWDKGSWIVFDGTHTIYAHKAKANELWAFDIPTQTWGVSPKTGMPLTGRSGRTKKAGDGGCGTWCGDAIYALKGASTQELWRYRPAVDSWIELETIPAYGSTQKKKTIKSGGGITTAEDVMLALKGNKCRELWRYRLGTYSAGSEAGREGATASASAIDDCRITIVPNPLVSGFATIRLSPFAHRHSPCAIRVFDAAGRCVQSAVCNLKSEMALDLQGLRPGVYLVRLDSRHGSWQRKLVIQD